MSSPEIDIKFLIIDDDEIDREVIEMEAAKFPFLKKIASFDNPVGAMEILSAGHADVIFLDIEMPELTGIELVQKRLLRACLPVFVTSHPEYALNGFELDAFDYLMKPVSSERFASCAFRLRDFFEMRNKACSFDDQNKTDFIIVKQGHDKYKIDLQNILFLEAMRDYTRIVTDTKQYLVLSTLTGLTGKLPEDNFVRIHRSYVVNRNKINAVQKNKVIIVSYELPIGKQFKFVLDFPL